MAAYIIVSVEVENPVRYEEYRKTVLPTIEAYGGRFLVRGGKMEVLEGSWPRRRIVVVEFPSYEKAHAWWHSPEYEKPKAMRQAASQTDMILVEGI